MKQQQQSVASVESLEARQLLAATAPRVLSTYLDNRGMAEFNFSAALDTATLSKKTASLYSAGTDAVFGTGDDVRLASKVGYNKGRLTVRATTAVNARYRVVLNASVIKGVNGLAIDGEFNSNGTSGNGTAGGNLDVVSSPSNKTRARFTTTLGFINIGLYKNTPNTKSNFGHYANEAAWDNTFFHRSTRDATSNIQVIQGGGYNVTSGQIGSVHQETGIGLELGNSNVKGTIAMARTSDVNSNTNQWFFNVNDNTALNTTGGGYTAFGAVLDTPSQRTIEAINTLTIANAGGVFTELPILNASHSASPLISDLVLVSRVAFLMDATAIQLAAPAAAQASAPLAAPAALFSSAKITGDDALLA